MKKLSYRNEKLLNYFKFFISKKNWNLIVSLKTIHKTLKIKNFMCLNLTKIYRFKIVFYAAIIKV